VPQGANKTFPDFIHSDFALHRTRRLGYFLSPVSLLKIKKQLTFGKIALGTALLGITAGIGLMVREFPDVSVLNQRYPQVLYQGSKQPIKVKLVNSPPAGWTRIDQIAKPAMGAVVVSEDWAFFAHDGFDANQLKEAIQEDLAEGKFSRGASTITMQVVKNVFLTQEKTLYRKGKEFIMAIWMSRKVPKRKVLEVYFNIAEWGEGVFGIGAASRHYFGKSAAELTPREGAFLAMLLPSPKRYSQSFRDGQLTPYAAKTVRSILEKMTQAHYITEEERDLAIQTRMSFEKGNEPAPLVSDGISTPEEGELELPRELDLGESDG